MEWISVKDRLPVGTKPVGYEEYMTDVVLVIHQDRPGYPITAHAVLGDNLESRGVCIPTNGASKFREIAWYSAGRDLQNPFGRKDQDYSRFLSNRFGRLITHWMPIPNLPNPSTEG